jgi:uncharacterized protein (TIGR04255 family)
VPSQPPIYQRPPIVEAVIDFLLSQKLDDESYEHVVGHLVKEYPNRDKKDEGDELVMDLSSPNGRRHILLGQSTVSAHVLAPYPGWESLLDVAREALDALPESVRVAGASSVSVRYMDRIEFPIPEPVFNEYITIMPNRPAGMPKYLSAFTAALLSEEPETGTAASLMITCPPWQENKNPEILCDVRVERRGTSPISLTTEEWLKAANDLHATQRQIFEASITDKTRELFQ